MQGLPQPQARVKYSALLFLNRAFNMIPKNWDMPPGNDITAGEDMTSPIQVNQFTKKESYKLRFLLILMLLFKRWRYNSVLHSFNAMHERKKNRKIQWYCQGGKKNTAATIIVGVFHTMILFEKHFYLYRVQCFSCKFQILYKRQKIWFYKRIHLCKIFQW